VAKRFPPPSCANDVGIVALSAGSGICCNRQVTRLPEW